MRRINEDCARLRLYTRALGFGWYSLCEISRKSLRLG